MFDRNKFNLEKRDNITKLCSSKEVNDQALNFIVKADKFNYAYNWTWMDLPIIQMPEDIVLMQEIIWEVKPDVIVETGIAWGGSVVLYASILELIGNGQVIAIDKVLPQQNIDAIMAYKFSSRIKLFEGSSTNPQIIETVKQMIKPSDSVMVVLDSNHTHEHVYDELHLYAPLVTKDSFLVVSDTIIEEIPEQNHRPRPWGQGNNPMTAVNAFLPQSSRFTRENTYNKKAISSFTRNGYLKCL